MNEENALEKASMARSSINKLVSRKALENWQLDVEKALSHAIRAQKYKFASTKDEKLAEIEYILFHLRINIEHWRGGK